MRAALIALSACVAITGCSGNKLRGKVIRGDGSFVSIVDASDGRLEGDGIPNVSLRLVMDPNKLNSKVIGVGSSNAEGDFELEIDEFGAGFLEFDTEFTARKPEYEPAMSIFRLPGGGKRVLVSLGPGKDRSIGADREDLRDQAGKYWR